jgi:NTE family protein
MSRARGMICGLSLALGLALGLGGCASLNAQVNAPLTADGATTGYRLGEVTSSANSDELLVIVSFSGGGKRSSAFGYGALMAMRDIRFTYGGRERSLLEEADILTGVSGGSFPAAYYALYRERIFETFKTDFLDEDLNGDIAGIYLFPWRWDWLVNPNWGTNDEMARIYDEKMFRGATFGDLARLGPPFAMIQATDLANGAPFPFTQTQFDLICSDISSYPVARAVAASNGFPVLFTPITLKNYRPGCAVPAPDWVARALRDPDPLSRQRQQALLALSYLDGGYAHLVDGGTADNLALRGILDYMSRYDNPAQAASQSSDAILKTRRVIFLSIDGQAEQDREISRTPVVGDVLRVVSAVTSNTIDNYNFETLRLARTAGRNLADNLTRLRCSQGGQGARAQLAHIALSDQPNAGALKDIPTGLTISPEQADQLTEAGRSAVLNDPGLKTAIAEINAPDPCPGAQTAAAK